jgi:U4/U6 small nuclear ribonucleoprotein PRP31
MGSRSACYSLILRWNKNVHRARRISTADSTHTLMMATLADELLNDFEDSGSEKDDHEQNGFLENEAHSQQNDPPGMELDEDEEEVTEAEEELATQHDSTNLKDAPDEEETKARVEKMKLGAVNDVRSVAGLMKTLQPVLEVRIISESLPY